MVAAALRQRGQQGLLVLWSYLFATTEAEPERVLALLPLPLRRRLEKTLMSTAERLRNEGHAQGHIEGRTEGHIEGRAELLLRLLERRFGPLPPAIRKRVHAVDGAQLDRWADAFVDARTLADVFVD